MADLKSSIGRPTILVIDVCLVPIVYLSAWLLKLIRRVGVYRMPCCKRVLMSVGVFPIREHYYEPQFDYRSTPPALDDRVLSGIDWNDEEQLSVLESMRCSDELVDIPLVDTPSVVPVSGKVPEFYMNNVSFEAGDAEYWYQFIRLKRPKRILEVGSGNSTLIAIRAIRRIRELDPSYKCKHICIEPYEAPWLENAGVSVIREKIESVPLSFFSELEMDDILFIDSSHMVRPRGDVLYEFLEILPTLNRGVVVHVHDIFSPRNYPKEWIVDLLRFWNEQYILEAFLSHNSDWKILGALNYLKHNHYEELKVVAPFLTPDKEPGSFYLQRVR